MINDTNNCTVNSKNTNQLKQLRRLRKFEFTNLTSTCSLALACEEAQTEQSTSGGLFKWRVGTSPGRCRKICHGQEEGHIWL